MKKTIYTGSQRGHTYTNIANIARYDDQNNLQSLAYFYKRDQPDYTYTFKTDTNINGDKIIAQII